MTPKELLTLLSFLSILCQMVVCAAGSLKLVTDGRLTVSEANSFISCHHPGLFSQCVCAVNSYFRETHGCRGKDIKIKRERRKDE